MKGAEVAKLYGWTAADVVRAYKTYGENFELIKKTFSLTAPQLRKLLREAGIRPLKRMEQSGMEAAGLRIFDFVSQREAGY